MWISAGRERRTVGRCNFGAKLLRNAGRGCPRNTARIPVCRDDTFQRSGTRSLRGVFSGGGVNFSCAEVGGPAMRSFRGQIAVLRSKVNDITYTSKVTTLAGTFLGVLRTKSRVITTYKLCNKAIRLFSSLGPFKVSMGCIGRGGPRTFRTRVARGAQLIFTRAVNGPGLSIASVRTITRITRGRSMPLVMSGAITAPCLVRPLGLKTSVIIRSSSGCVGKDDSTVDNVLIYNGNLG